MARPRKTSSPISLATNPSLMSWAETIGEALGRGVARGINTGISTISRGSFGMMTPMSTMSALPRRRGRPPKALTGGPVPAERRCKVDGCGREARSKGLCSAHYQAERRRLLAKA
jgi:hypothetical protein